ncbi:MAG: glycerophosphodiester phosphodiesterase [Erysipelotrichaceae bacterium]|nr:glycerophosphodiester phosphodiesterase [Erysipelotrichaceae bacterium]
MKTPLIWGHRGDCVHTPENTLIAFERAVRDGADGVELDIQLSKDGEIVVCHDETLDRTSNAKGWLKDYTLAELKSFNFNQKFPEYGFQPIPTMREVLELLKPSGLTIDIELKTSYPTFYPQIEDKILALVRELGMEEKANYSSFNHYTCRRLLELDPTLDVGFLYFDGTMDFPDYAKSHGAKAINPAYFNLFLPGEPMKRAQELGLTTRVWTVDAKEEVEACIEKGIDVIITNDPAGVRKILSQR